jgi:hypothetical protein
METMTEATDRLRVRGYRLDFPAIAGGRLRCAACGEIVEAEDAIVDETVRFEGISNPDDQAILSAITTSCGHRGLFTAAYGVYTSTDDVEVLQALTRPLIARSVNGAHH